MIYKYMMTELDMGDYMIYTDAGSHTVAPLHPLLLLLGTFTFVLRKKKKKQQRNRERG